MLGSGWSGGSNIGPAPPPFFPLPLPFPLAPPPLAATAAAAAAGFFLGGANFGFSVGGASASALSAGFFLTGWGKWEDDLNEFNDCVPTSHKGYKDLGRDAQCVMNVVYIEAMYIYYV